MSHQFAYFLFLCSSTIVQVGPSGFTSSRGRTNMKLLGSINGGARSLGIE